MNGPINLTAAQSLIKACEKYGYSEAESLGRARVMIAANKLSPGQKYVLIEHAAGERQIIVREMQSILCLEAMGLIRFTKNGGVAPEHPSHSFPTEMGRQVMAYLLAELAETLMAAHEATT